MLLTKSKNINVLFLAPNAGVGCFFRPESRTGFSKDKIFALLEKVNVKQNDKIDPKFEIPIHLGNFYYSIAYISDENKPLFSHSTQGKNVLINLNKSHYFYANSESFKLQIITMVHNLIKHYSYEYLEEDLQSLFNPPAKIKLNYKKEYDEVN